VRLGKGWPDYRPVGPPLTGTSNGGRPMITRYAHQAKQDPQIQRDAQLSTEAPRVPWDVFVTEQFLWRSGEHVALIGPTGQGKTTMLLNLLPLHPYVVVFVTKPVDTTMSSLATEGYHRMERWHSLDPDKFPRRLLWPDATRLNAQVKQRQVFADAFERIYRERGWTVAIDELWYVSTVLKLEGAVRVYLQQSRSLGISLLVATQRPARVPVEVYDQCTHLFFWRDNDRTNLDRISGIAYRSSQLIRSIVADLEDHQMLYVNTRTGYMARTRCPDVRG
jgi:energy-coupling factor transporter ATP-binding protein EcfA2